MSDTRIRILVPSSERKHRGGTRAFTFSEAQDERHWNRYPSLSRPRREAVGAFMSAINGQGHAREVLRLEGERLEEARRVNLSFKRGALMPAFERERGPLFSTLEPSRLDEAKRRLLQEELVIVCPLLGLLSPSDMVPEYRCPVGAQIPGWRSLHHHWKPTVGPILDRLCRGRRVFSFLPARLRALWTPRMSQEVVTVQFATRKPDGGLRASNAGAGRLAGAMIKSLIVDRQIDPADLQDWISPAGHRYSAVHSDHREGSWKLVYVK